MNRKFLIALGLSIAVVVTASVAVWAWRREIIKNRSEVSHELIQQELKAQNFVSARTALQGIASPEAREDQEREIRKAELAKALDTRDTAMMRLAIDQDGETWMDPKLLESADLELARESLHSENFDAYQKTVEKWKGKSAMPGQWILLEADQLLARRMIPEATEFLKNAKLTGSEDALRYARLALLQANEPWKAMETIDQGLKAEPTNAELLSFRAQIQEAGGRPTEARYDYVAAVLSDRKNPIHRDNLANYYLRQGDAAAAAETWRDTVIDTGLGVYAVKAWFWNRVSGTPFSQPLPIAKQRGGWVEMSDALANIPADVFWNADAESRRLKITTLQNRPEIIWLTVLEHVRKQEYIPAYEILERDFPKNAENLWPNVATYLRVHLAAICGQNPRLPLASHDLSPLPENTHSFLKSFHRWAKREDTEEERKLYDAWLTQPGSLVSTLLSSGWAGAALILGRNEAFVLPPGSPEGLDYAYAKALLIHQDKTLTRKWLESLPIRSSAANLLLGEILISTNALEDGLKTLRLVADSKSPIASRALWTLALAELERNQPAKTREIILSDATFAQSVPGRELLARAALAENQREETIRIYKELGESSADAMIFLSKEAFAAKDYEQARKWTLLLARRFPEQPEFRKNLIKIQEAQKPATP